MDDRMLAGCKGGLASRPGPVAATRDRALEAGIRCARRRDEALISGDAR